MKSGPVQKLDPFWKGVHFESGPFQKVARSLHSAHKAYRSNKSLSYVENELFGALVRPLQSRDSVKMPCDLIDDEDF
jgi:hypothetical protein